MGKTTFLNVLMGNQPLDSGEVVTGETVRQGVGCDLAHDAVVKRLIVNDSSSYILNRERTGS